MPAKFCSNVHPVMFLASLPLVILIRLFSSHRKSSEHGGKTSLIQSWPESIPLRISKNSNQNTTKPHGKANSSPSIIFC
ncbi:hypothetical protein I7I48_04071 [Histoplasma ohiense]|nr:hypothetical protein I7I48_04071 [Histoplasma ohiense (nom. inval.)]